MKAVAALLLGVSATAAWAQFQPIQIPLTVGKDDQGENKVGLFAMLGGSNIAKLYQLDTGSSGFFAAYAPNPDVPQWWGGFTPIDAHGVAGYGSDVSLNFDVVSTNVTLSNAQGTPLLTVCDAQIGRVKTASNPSDWEKLTKDGVAPLHGDFFGNFGAALYQHSASGPAPASLFTLLGQIPNAGGFIVHIGDASNIDPDNPPMLTVGITNQMREAFPYASPLTAATGQTFPTTGYQGYEEYSSVADVSLNLGGDTQEFTGVPTLFDTGGQSSTLRTNVDAEFYTPNPDNSDEGPVKNCTIFSVTLPGAGESPDFTLSWPVGDVQSYNAVNIDNNGDDNLNAGLNPYAYYDIMFDIEEGMIRFRPIPEPATVALALFGVAAAVIFRRRIG